MTLALSACKDTCRSFGYTLPKLVFTDDPYRDKIFFNEIFPILQDTSNAANRNCTNSNEILIEYNHISSIISGTLLSIDDYFTYPNYYGISSLCSRTKDEMVNKENVVKKVISLDCEWELHRNSM